MPDCTPSAEGRPSFSRKKARDPGPKSGKLRSVASEASRTSPIDFKPAEFKALRILVGDCFCLSGKAGLSAFLAAVHLPSLLDLAGSDIQLGYLRHGLVLKDVLCGDKQFCSAVLLIVPFAQTKNTVT